MDNCPGCKKGQLKLITDSNELSLGVVDREICFMDMVLFSCLQIRMPQYPLTSTEGYIVIAAVVILGELRVAVALVTTALAGCGAR